MGDQPVAIYSIMSTTVSWDLPSFKWKLSTLGECSSTGKEHQQQQLWQNSKVEKKKKVLSGNYKKKSSFSLLFFCERVELVSSDVTSGSVRVRVAPGDEIDSDKPTLDFLEQLRSNKWTTACLIPNRRTGRMSPVEPQIFGVNCSASCDFTVCDGWRRKCS